MPDPDVFPNEETDEENLNAEAAKMAEEDEKAAAELEAEAAASRAPLEKKPEMVLVRVVKFCQVNGKSYEPDTAHTVPKEMLSGSVAACFEIVE